MKSRIFGLLFLFVFLAVDKNFAQSAWKAKWIWVNNRQFPDWQRAKSYWINPPGPGLKPYRALFRKTFYISRLPEQGKLFMTADVRFRAYINGSPVAEGPDNTGGDYGDNKSPSYWYYSSYDVRSRLRTGINTIAVEVFAWALESSDVTSSFGRLIGELRNGDKDLVATDTSWKANIDSSYSYSGDFLQYDAGSEAEGWKTSSFSDGSWAPASFQHSADSTRLYQSRIPGQMHYPVQPLRLFKVKAATNPIGDEITSQEFYGKRINSSRYILDFGRNLAAHISFAATADKGDTLEVASYEKMGSDPVAGRKYRYICKKGINIFRTPNVSPFRYLEARVGSGKGLTIQQFDADFTSYPVLYRGSFSCSNPFYNRLWSVIRYTTQLCMGDMYFDSPMHQEPIGCTGDYFIESMNSYYAFGDSRLTRQNLIQTAQMMEKNDYRMFHTSYSLLWVQMLRQYVQFTGDTALLGELLPHADKLMSRFKGYLNKDHLVADAPNYMFMDWITINGFNAHHPPAMIGMGYMSALLYKSMRDIDDMRRLLGRDGSYPRYAATADSIRTGINKILWDPVRKLYRDGIPFLTDVSPNSWLPADSNLITYTPHVNTLAVLYDIAPPDSREGIMDYVVTQKEYELQPYFMSYVLGAVRTVGWQDRGLELIDRWRNGIDTSTYTLKENWRDKTDFGYNGDFSHAWGGAPLRWLSGNILGISPETPGYAQIAIRPYSGDQLHWAKGAVPVGKGESVLVSWKKKTGGFYFEYTIPAGKTAHFYIPASLEGQEWSVDGRICTRFGSIVLTAGKHIVIEHSAGSSGVRKNAEVLPTIQQVAWANKEIGVIIHLDINIYVPETFDYARRETLPDVNVFNPTKLNTDQWIRTAKAAGARYAVLTVKHGTGFCLWPSKANGYNVGHTRWLKGKGDILKAFLASCKKYGVEPGLYYNTNSNSYYGAGYVPFVNDSAHAAYNKVVIRQLTELWSDYGKMFEIWFDGGVSTDDRFGIDAPVLSLVRTRQPQAVLFQGPVKIKNILRWVGNEDGKAAYPQWSRTNEIPASDGRLQIDDRHGDPDGKIWCPAESDFPIRRNSAWNGGWLWRAGQEKDLFTVDELVDKYYHSVGRNTNMLIGMVVDTSGLIPVADSLVFDSLGKKINGLFGKPVSIIKDIHERVVEWSAPVPKKVSQVVVREDISKGEHVRSYSIEVWTSGGWKEIASGLSIGHKRIQTFEPITTQKFRFSIKESEGLVSIRDITFY
jgi:alpha-L-fucosidase